ncbi:hypothetical protein BSP239C_03605 [Brevibacterium sp. 239c]|nr:hypothetical protein BSP239C_03605 [Brevibacterium sp. 239c]
MRLSEAEERAFLAAMRGETPKPAPAPHVWKPDAPVIDMQANNPTGMSHAEWERLQNMAATHGGDHNGITRATR